MFLTSPRSVVKKKYLRSRKAPAVCAKTLKVQNRVICHKIWHEWSDLGCKCTIFWFLQILSKLRIHSRNKFVDESQICYQEKVFEISQSTRCLCNTLKVQNRAICHKIWNEWFDVWCNCTISWFFCKFDQN